MPGPLEGVGPQVDDLRPRRLDANGGGDVPLENGEVDLPVVVADGVEVPHLVEVHDLLAG